MNGLTIFHRFSNHTAVKNPWNFNTFKCCIRWLYLWGGWKIITLCSYYLPWSPLCRRTHHHWRSGTGIWGRPFCFCPTSSRAAPLGTETGGSLPPPPPGPAGAASSPLCGGGWLDGWGSLCVWNVLGYFISIWTNDNLGFFFFYLKKLLTIFMV